ncbi:MAG: hypothetical protein U9R42_06335 [Bacteroidota bacterium]|nr:hypothetical protein [Bacteroidota bacterium]
MKSKTLFLSLIALIIFTSVSFADSPITSTYFATAYKDYKIIKKASEANGLLTKKLMKYLLKKKNPIDVKMAIINELSWDIDGRTNSVIFFDFLKKERGYADKEDFLKNASGDEILCMAYLKAMDDYFDVNEALVFAKKALEKNNKSYTFNIITALISAQKAFDTNWCQVYHISNNVRINKELKMDMKSKAIEIIFDYQDIYLDTCE